MSERRQIFISSMQKELADKRRALRDFIDELCAQAGLPTPEFRQTGGQFVLALRRPAPAVTPEVTLEVTPEVARMLRTLGTQTLSRRELQQALGLKDDEHFRTTHLRPALEADLLQMTLPDRPNSRLQKYRVTTKGRVWLNAQTPHLMTAVSFADLMDELGVSRATLKRDLCVGLFGRGNVAQHTRGVLR